MTPMLASKPGISRGEAMKEIGKLWRARGEKIADAEIDNMVGGMASLSVKS